MPVPVTGGVAALAAGSGKRPQGVGVDGIIRDAAPGAAWPGTVASLGVAASLVVAAGAASLGAAASLSGAASLGAAASLVVVAGTGSTLAAPGSACAGDVLGSALGSALGSVSAWRAAGEVVPSAPGGASSVTAGSGDAAASDIVAQCAASCAGALWGVHETQAARCAAGLDTSPRSQQSSSRGAIPTRVHPCYHSIAHHS